MSLQVPCVMPSISSWSFSVVSKVGPSVTSSSRSELYGGSDMVICYLLRLLMFPLRGVLREKMRAPRRRCRASYRPSLFPLV